MKRYFLQQTTHVLVVALALLAGCGADDDKVNEVPEGIIPSRPCTTLYKGIMGMFREHQNNQQAYPFLFSDTIRTELVITRETDIYVTFISEGAGWANTLGWYAYPANSDPGSGVAKHVLFPHVSDAVLQQGDMLKLEGRFPAGTVVGFYLILRGWENGTINERKPFIFTNTNWNTNQYQQHVLFKEGDCGDVVVAFEDRLLNDTSCDYDFNDVIFTVADNAEQREITAFDLRQVVVM